MNDKKIKIKLKELALKKGLTFVALSEQTSIPYAWISNFANNHISLIQVDKLLKLCCVLDCQPNDLLEIVSTY